MTLGFLFFSFPSLLFFPFLWDFSSLPLHLLPCRGIPLLAQHRLVFFLQLFVDDGTLVRFVAVQCCLFGCV
jgi:hypothetical protein